MRRSDTDELATYNDQENDDSDDNNIFDTIIKYVSILVTLPLFLLLSKILPDPDWVINLDRILLFLITFVVVYFVAISHWFLTFVGLIAGIAFLSYGSFASGDHYGWGNAVFDYASLIKSLYNDDKEGVYVLVEINEEPSEIYILTKSDEIDSDLNTIDRNNDKKEDKTIESKDSSDFTDGNYCLDIVDKKNSNYYSKKIKEACDYLEVRDFALKIINENDKFKEKADLHYKYRTFIQSCAICKYVNEKWQEVSDPQGEEYFAKASETIQHFQGDNDDYAIVLASLIKAIGGETRIVWSNGYAYPEIKIDRTSWNDVNCLIKSVLYEELGIDLLYHNISGDDIWLSMDNTGPYPGTELVNKNPKDVFIIAL